MKRVIILVVLFFIGSFTLVGAQTDLAIVGYAADGDDQFAFVALADLIAGDEIRFTDSGWLNTNVFRGFEGALKYTVPFGGISKGTVVSFMSPASGDWSIDNDATVGTNGMILSTDGDQILAFRGPSDSPTFSYALNNEGAAIWQTNATTSNTSALPIGLVNGETAVALTEVDNASYTGPTSGTVTELLGWIGNPANWTSDNSTPQPMPTGPFVIIEGGGNEPIIVDDGDAGFSTTGEWFPQISGGYQLDYTYANQGFGQITATATWTFTGLTPGTYQVAATWPSGAEPEAQYLISDDATPLATVIVNQQSDPSDFEHDMVMWQNMGLFDIASSTLAVTLNNDAGTYVIADAVYIRKIDDPIRISGTVTESGNPVPGVLMEFSNGGGAETTGPDGTYSRPILSGWSGTVTPSKTDYTFDPTSRAYLPVTNNVTGADYLASGPPLQACCFFNESCQELTENDCLAADGFPAGEGTDCMSHSCAWDGVIADNLDNQFSTVGANWNLHPAGYRDVVSLCQNGDGTQTAQWTFSGLAPGHYEVSATWQSVFSPATNAPFYVHDGALQHGPVLVDQTLNPDDYNLVGANWEGLGIYPLTGTTLVVELTNAANGLIIADAIHVRPVDGPDISGIVTDGSNPLSGVIIDFSNNGGTALTDGSGGYSQPVMPGWSGTATPSLTGYVFDPLNQTYTNVTIDQVNQDYTGTIAPVACCQPDGSCVELSPAECLAQGGVPGEIGSACASWQCPQVSVATPNGGEVWTGGSSHDITWTSNGTVGDLAIDYSTNNGSDWNPVTASTPNDGSFQWTVPNEPSAECLIKISDTTGPVFDLSDAVFEITPTPTLTVTAPNGGENWAAGSTHAITWTSTGNITAVNLAYSTDNGVTTTPIATDLANSGSHDWTLPVVSSTACGIHITTAGGDWTEDFSDQNFTIYQPGVAQDNFDRSQGLLMINIEGQDPAVIELLGSSGWERRYDGPTVGDVSDDDGNGRDEIATEMVELSLTGFHESLGLVEVNLHGSLPSPGQMEEQPPAVANGNLDFAVDSFFDIYFEIHLDGIPLHSESPVRITGQLDNPPADPGNHFTGQNPADLLTEAGQPSGKSVALPWFQPTSTIENDYFPISIGQIRLDDGAGKAGRGTEDITMIGDSFFDVFFEGPAEGDAQDNDGDGQDEVLAELMGLELTGTSPTHGPVDIRLKTDGPPSVGHIREQANNNANLLDLPPFGQAGTADSFFDIFFEVDFDGSTYHGLIPAPLTGTISAKPPRPGDVFLGDLPIPLYYESGQPSMYTLTFLEFYPNPPRDYGDAPDHDPTIAGDYPTLEINNGASHVIIPELYIGQLNDDDFDGQPTGLADGDDADGFDDEDGLVDPAQLQIVQGTQPTIDIQVTNLTDMPVTLYGWIDYNRDGYWETDYNSDPDPENAYQTIPASVVDHVVSLTFPQVPVDYAGETFARFRLTSFLEISPNGAYEDGEVEDYQINIIEGDNQPYAVIGAIPNPAACNQTITLDSQGSYHGHPAHVIMSYEWDFDYDGQNFDVDDTGETATHAYPQFGTYTAALRVTDDNTPALTDIATVTIDVDQGNQPPTAAISAPAAINRGEDLSLNGSGSSDPNASCGDQIVQYKWDFNNDGLYDDATGPVVDLSAAQIAGWPSNVPIPIGLQVTDSFDLTGTTSHSVTINESCIPTYHTIVIDGVNDFRPTSEEFVTTTDGWHTYLTWDDAALYLGYSGQDINADGKVMFAYIDTDPTTPATDGSGSTAAISWNTDHTLPFTANYGFVYKVQPNDDYWNLRRYDGGWQGDQNYSGVPWMNTGYFEVSLPWADIGNPDKIYITLFVQEDTGAWTWNGTPAGSFADGNGNKVMTKHLGYEIIEGVCPNDAQYVDRLFTPQDYDFGDAPDPMYPTLLAHDGARHVYEPGYHLGALLDIDPDGQPETQSLGDDADSQGDDEDGVSFLLPIVQGSAIAQVQVTASAAGVLNAWIDFNIDGDWSDVGEHVFTNVNLVQGLNILTYSVPGTAGTEFPTFARFRFSSAAGLSFIGEAPDGEVEDYQIQIHEPTSQIGDFVWHDLNGDGIQDDGEPGLDGLTVHLLDNTDAILQTTLTANNGFYSFTTNPGGYKIQVIPPMGFVFSPMDAAGDDTIDSDIDPATGKTALFGTISGSVMMTYDAGLVEEIITEYDFGDAPDPMYPTLLAHDGARHVYEPGYHLGALLDIDTDGQPETQSLGDDSDGQGDDEDGVSFLLPIVQGSAIAQVQVTASAAGVLNAWIDFNIDGDWSDVGEHVFTNVNLVQGLNILTYSVPGTAGTSVPTFARFRFSSAAGLSFIGEAPDGEVEDYQIQIHEPTSQIGDFVWHDLNGDGIQDDGEPGLDGLTVHLLDNTDAILQTTLTANNGFYSFTTNPGGYKIQVIPPMGFVFSPMDAAGDDTIDSDINPATGKTALFGTISGSVMMTYDAGLVEEIVTEYDFGDAPDPYPTLLANDGARHGLDQNLFMGFNPPDAELDGQPDLQADGDDMLDGYDDEDGVMDPNQLRIAQGSAPSVDVRVTNLTGQNATLYGWIDYNIDGYWATDYLGDPDPENATVMVPPGTIDGIVTLNFPTVPQPILKINRTEADEKSRSKVLGLETFARFRLSVMGDPGRPAFGLAPHGEAPSGEVEDYQAYILPPPNNDPTLTFDPVTPIDENGTATLTGTIADPDVTDTFTLDIDWGDGSGVVQHNFGASATGSQTFSLTHQYLDDNPTGTTSDHYNISGTVTDSDNGSATDDVAVTVNNVAPTISADHTEATAQVGQPANNTGTYSDVGTLDTFQLSASIGAVVDNGDGTWSWSYTPASSNESQTVTVTITDDDTGVGQTTFELEVSSSQLLLSGLVWDDTNGNGIREAGETMLDGITVELYNANLVLEDVTVTSGGGLYSFNVNPGTYHVKVIPVLQMVPTLMDRGADDMIDSDVDHAGLTDAVVVSTTNVDHVDAGLFEGVEQVIHLPQYYAISWISSHLDLESRGLLAGDIFGLGGVFGNMGTLSAQTVDLMTGASQTVWPNLPLTPWDNQAGYFVFSPVAGDFSFYGHRLAEDTPITMNVAGRAYFVAYYPAVPLTPANALASIAGSYQMVMGYTPTGPKFYMPDFPAYSTLQQMLPGYGYQVAVLPTATMPLTLTYPTNRVAEDNPEPVQDFNRATQSDTYETTHNFHVILFQNADNLNLMAGDEILAYAERDGQLFCIGGVVWDGRTGFILYAWQDNPLTERKDGFVDGEPIILKLFSQETQDFIDLEVGYQVESSMTYNSEYPLSIVDSAALSVDEPEAVNVRTRLEQNVPNPFNPSTVIGYSLAEQAPVKLSIFNATGQLVRTLVNTAQDAGQYEITWDGRDDKGQELSSGLYFYRLDTPKESQTRRMVFLK